MVAAQFGERCAGMPGGVGESRIIAKPVADIEADGPDQQTDGKWDSPAPRGHGSR